MSIQFWRPLLVALTALLVAVPLANAHRSEKPHHAPTERAEDKYVDVRYAAKELDLTVGPRIHLRGVRFKWCSEDGDRCHWGKRDAYASDIADKIRDHRSDIQAYKRAKQRRSGGAGGILAAIRQCESGGNYRAATGNGFYGAYQFTPGTWRAYGGSGMPHTASPGEQDRVARRLLNAVGYHTSASWPNCP